MKTKMFRDGILNEYAVSVEERGTMVNTVMGKLVK